MLRIPFAIFLFLLISAADISARPGNLVFSTFLGATGDERGLAVAVDSKGYVYVAGSTASPRFPVTPGAIDSTLNESDVFVAKLTPDGSSVVFSTLIGGKCYDTATDIALDPEGNIYVAGTTCSGGFPTTPGAYCNSGGGFILKINPEGNKLLYSTCVSNGNSWIETVRLRVDPGGCAFFTMDTVAAKLDRDGSRLLFSTVLRNDQSCARGYSITGMDIDGEGCMYLAGTRDISSGDLLFTENCLDCDPRSGSFACKLGPDGTIAWCTYLFGTDPQGIAVDASGRVWITGNVHYSQNDLPLSPGAYREQIPDAGGVFLCGISPEGDRILVSTRFGRVLSISGKGCRVMTDSRGNIFVLGLYPSADFTVTPDALPSSPTERDGFLSVFDPTGSTLLYSTILAGFGADCDLDLAMDSRGSAYIVGTSPSGDSPVTAGAFDTSFNGKTDVIVCKLSFDFTPVRVTESPLSFRLRPAFPNPFNPSTTIGFDLPEPGRVELSVYNALGQKIRGLVSEHLCAGPHAAVWDSRDDSGKAVASGVYFARLSTGGRTDCQKMLLVR